MRLLFIFFINIFFCFAAVAQKGNAEQKEAIHQLQWMIGNWSGTSIAMIDSQKIITNIRESVEPALDATILLINVRATDKDSNTNRQSLAYTSFSVISYDLKNKRYLWTSWRNNGNNYDQHEFKVGSQSFEYSSTDNGNTTRYKAALGSEGEFLETGEYSKKGGAWEPFISMKLTKSGR